MRKDLESWRRLTSNMIYKYIRTHWRNSNIKCYVIFAIIYMDTCFLFFFLETAYFYFQTKQGKEKTLHVSPLLPPITRYRYLLDHQTTILRTSEPGSRSLQSRSNDPAVQFSKFSYSIKSCVPWLSDNNHNMLFLHRSIEWIDIYSIGSFFFF